MYRGFLGLPDGWPRADAILPYAQPLAQSLGAEIVFLRFKHENLIDMKYPKRETAGMRVSFLIQNGPITNSVLAIAGSVQVE
jgi:hypothetical protein